VREVDVVVIGAGIVGAACAHALVERGPAEGRLSVLVLEQAAGHSEGSTGRSCAGVRVQWADPLNIWLAWTGIQAYRSFPERMAADAGYHDVGYLLLVPEEGWASHLAAVELQRSMGAPVEIVDLDQVGDVTPCRTDGLGGATLGTADGTIDPQRATDVYLARARDRGAVVEFHSGVHTIVGLEDGSWEVETPRGRVATRWVVNAAGGWSGEVAALAGLGVPVAHSRRNVFATGALPFRVPMTLDVGTGVFLRSEGDRVIFGLARPEEPTGYDVAVDWPWLEGVLTTAVPRFPWLAEAPLDRRASWAGTYEVTPDDLPVIGPMPTAPTWVNACGFSGHGVMQAPAVGQLVAEAIVDGAITSVDVTPASIERFGTEHLERARLIF